MDHQTEPRLPLHIDGDPLPVWRTAPDPDGDPVSLDDVLARVLPRWRGYASSHYARVWRRSEGIGPDRDDEAILVRRADRTVHIVGVGEVADGLRLRLRQEVDGWRLHELPEPQTPLKDAELLLGSRVYGMLTRYGFSTLEEIAAVPTLMYLGIRLFGPKTQLVVDSVLARYLTDDDAAEAARERRREHINRRLSAVHQARNRPLLDLLAASDLSLGALDQVLESLAAEVVPPADLVVLNLLREPGQSDLAAVYARTHAPTERSDSV